MDFSKDFSALAPPTSPLIRQRRGVDRVSRIWPGQDALMAAEGA